MARPHILVIGNESPGVRAAIDCLLRNSIHAETVDFSTALTKISSSHIRPDVVMLVLGNREEGLETLVQLQQRQRDLRIVVLCQGGTNRQVIEGIRLLGQDCLTFPFHDIKLLSILKKYVSATERTEIETLEEVGSDHFFSFASVQMNKVRLQAELLADMEVPVLIVGESGTGKDVIAQLIHKLSARSDQPFLKVNCAALSGDLLDRELFGYERGVSTHDILVKAGKLEMCDKGTILLDEICEMPINLQAKLLHVLREKQFFRLQGQGMVEADVRILATTSVDIQEAIAKGSVRKDLYYRLSTFNVVLPPLRERREEIPGLLRHFMQRTAAQYSRAPLPFSPRLMNACLQYAWPGNVRELHNFVQRYLVMADESMAVGELQAKKGDLILFKSGATDDAVRSISGSEETSRSDLKGLLRTLKDQTEVRAITNALNETNWNRKKAALLLHISYRGLLYKIRQHEIPRPSMGEATVAGPPITVGSRQEFAKAAAAVTNQDPTHNGRDHFKQSH
jgi:DNA-binding NtrC family response regulator